MSRLRLLFDWRFVRFALKRFSAGWYRLVRDYQRTQGAPADLAVRSDLFVSDYRYLTKDHSSVMSSSVRIITPIGPCDKQTGVFLGRSSYLGPNVYIEIGSGNVVRIGDETSINPNTVLIGDIWIGNHSMVAPDVYISSGNHFATYRPHWLIRDQDVAARADPLVQHQANQPVTIEDDCWIGKGVLIRSGVYIGRGAIIGANSVVTKDVPPYSIQAGLPNREIGRRFLFDPPTRIEAAEERHWPYFYYGFRMRQADCEDLVRTGVLRTREGSLRVVMRGGAFRLLHVKGMTLGSAGTMTYRIECNGAPLGRLECGATVFDSSLSVDPSVWRRTAPSSLPSVLREHNVLTLTPDAAAGKPAIGIASIQIS